MRFHIITLLLIALALTANEAPFDISPVYAQAPSIGEVFTMTGCCGLFLTLLDR